MGPTFGQIICSDHHFAHPFTSPPPHQHQSLTRCQKVSVVAMTIISGLLTLLIGAPFIFYISAAYFKASNRFRLQSAPIPPPGLIGQHGRKRTS